MGKSHGLSLSPGSGSGSHLVPVTHRLVLIAILTSLVNLAPLISVSATKEDADGLSFPSSDGDYNSGGNEIIDVDVNGGALAPSENNLGNLCQLLYNSRLSGGKRSFNPWGGKRSSSSAALARAALGFGFVPECDYVRQLSEFGKRATAFNPWGGKRNSNGGEGGGGGENSRTNNRVTKNDKNRIAFNPWGGKK